jgi:hypothetical protein
MASRRGFLRPLLAVSVLCLVLPLSACLQMRGLHGASEAETRRLVEARIPIGMPIRQATKIMQSTGYRCGPAPKGANVLCSSTTLTEYTDWRVSFVVKDGLVAGIEIDQWHTFL